MDVSIRGIRYEWVRPIYGFKLRGSQLRYTREFESCEYVVFLVCVHGSSRYIWGCREEEDFCYIDGVKILYKDNMEDIIRVLYYGKMKLKLKLMLRGVFRTFRQFDRDILGIPVNFMIN